VSSGVYPSCISVRSSDQRESYQHRATNDTTIHSGVVIAVYAPTDSKNVGKKQYQYDVEALVGRGFEIPSYVVYHRCIMSTTFGGISDKCVWTPRVRAKKQDGTVEEGTRVLIECINGMNWNPIIIGTMEPDTSAIQSPDFKNGPLLRWEYNGLFCEVNKDGELQVLRKGPTNGLGKQTSSSDDGKSGSKMVWDKDGKILLQTQDEKNSVSIDMKAGKIITVTKSGVELGGSSEKLIKGTTYVKAEKTFLQGLESFLLSLGGVVAALNALPLTAPAGAALATSVSAFAPQVIAFKAQLESEIVLSQKNTTE
jgi:hypothetical protein